MVPPDEIEETLQDDLTSVNPPIFQGWAVMAFVVAGAATLAGLGAFPRAEHLLVGLVGVFGPSIAWLAIVALGGVAQWTIELADNGIQVRRWFQVRVGRPGRWLGPPDQVQAAFNHHDSLRLEGPGGSVAIALWPWPPSSRARISDTLGTWGIKVGGRAERDELGDAR